MSAALENPIIVMGLMVVILLKGKGIGDVNVHIPRDRKGEFKTKVIPRSKEYEKEITGILVSCFI
jgi:transposase-like protein